MKGEEKRFIHSFKADVKIPENISNDFSYSLGQVIRPSILIKAPKGQKYLWGGKPEYRTQKGTPKQNENDPLVFQAFISLRCSFFCWCPLGSDAAFDYWCSFCNQPTLRNPSFCSEQHSSGSNKTFQRGKKIWIWLTSLYSQLPETQQGSGSTLGSQTDIKCQSPKVLFNTLQEVSWVLSQFACVLKKVLSMVIRFSCLRSQANQSERGEGRKGRYTDNIQDVAAVITGGGGKEGVCV